MVCSNGKAYSACKACLGPALQALEQQRADALQLTYGVLLGDAPNITKATVTGYLGAYPSRQTLMTAMQKLRSSGADTRRPSLYRVALKIIVPRVCRLQTVNFADILQ
jgi:hypothetical protein